MCCSLIVRQTVVHMSFRNVRAPAFICCCLLNNKLKISTAVETLLKLPPFQTKPKKENSLSQSVKSIVYKWRRRKSTMSRRTTGVLKKHIKADTTTKYVCLKSTWTQLRSELNCQRSSHMHTSICTNGSEGYWQTFCRRPQGRENHKRKRPCPEFKYRIIYRNNFCHFQHF